jgi:phosphoribosylanthranilate isomerase
LYSAKVKICGIRRPEDVQIVNIARPDLIGFILTPSRRRVTKEEALALKVALDPSILCVGVFAAETADEIADAAEYIGLDGIQLHMDTTPAFMKDLDARLLTIPKDRRPFVWQRIPVPVSAGSGADIKRRVESFPGLSRFDGLLLDTWKDREDGGSGSVFPWEPAKAFLEENQIPEAKIIVAGGLDEYNVAQAVTFFRPYAVDVSSRVETDGYKDHNKVVRFIEAVRKAQVL